VACPSGSLPLPIIRASYPTYERKKEPLLIPKGVCFRFDPRSTNTRRFELPLTATQAERQPPRKRSAQRRDNKQTSPYPKTRLKDSWFWHTAQHVGEVQRNVPPSPLILRKILRTSAIRATMDAVGRGSIPTHKMYTHVRPHTHAQPHADH